MQMQIRRLNLFLRPLQRRLMNAHTIREMRFKKVIVPPGHLSNRLSELCLLVLIEVNKGTLVRLANDHGLKWPHGPPRADDQERIVFKDHALLFLALERGVVG